MAKIKSSKTTREVINPDGSSSIETTERTSSVEPSGEPDYIKIYTSMWCEFNEIPEVWRGLFYQIACRMTYCMAKDLERSQIVYTGKPISTAIQDALGWGDRMYQKGLKALCECNAIRKVARGVYQINPHYAAKGDWKYNPRYDRGGIENLIATFNFKDRTVNTRVIWAGTPEEKELGLRPGEKVVATRTDFDQLPGQMSLDDPEITSLFNGDGE